MTPRARAFSATTNGVPPAREMLSTAARTSSGSWPPFSSRKRVMASVDPLRMTRPSRLTPDMRVTAVNGTNSALNSARSRPRSPYCSLASTTMERPSGVSSGREESWAASASCAAVMPGAVTNSAAWRLPSVMVPVLSSSSVFTSPAASTARPDMPTTLSCTKRSMPAMPMADSSPPMVVGMRQTSSEISTNTDCFAFE